MASWSGDVRLALRMLRRRPGFAVTVLATLALGIGANTALFGVFRTVFLEPLPLPESNQLTFVMEQGGFGCCGPASGPDYRDWAARQRTFSGMGVIHPGSVTLTGDGEAERVYATSASASVFGLLGVAPRLGRTFTTADQAAPSVVVLSYGLWQSRFGGRSDVLGTTLRIDGAPYTVVGVMPRGFDVPSPWARTSHHQLYTPFDDAWLEGNRGSHSYPVVARLAPGVTRRMAQADMDRIMRDLAREYPRTNSDRTARVFSAHDYIFGSAGRELALILGAAGLVLLIACGNVAGLQLARAAGRETELAVRSALGASRGALVRLLFSESVVIAVLGGLGGILVSFFAVHGLRSMMPPTIPRIADARVDGWALLFAVGASAVTAFAFGIIPSLIASRGDLAGGLRERGYSTFAPGKERIRDYFIVGQIALGLVLANGAALLVRSYARLLSQDPGFQARGVLTVSVRPAGNRYQDAAAVSTYYDEVRRRVGAIPGVQEVGTVSRLPLAGGSNGNVQIEGRPPRTSSDEGPLVEVASVSGHYFEAMGIKLLRGRTLVPGDTASGAVNVVINHHFAEEGWPGQNPLGKRFSFNDNPPIWRTVVGVVDDVRQWGPERPPVGQVYYPLTSGWSNSGYLVVRAQGDPGALAHPVRRAILAVDPSLAPSGIQTMTARVERAFAQRRFYTTLIGLFAIAALLLAGVGIYGTVSYYVTRRKRELGIRLALGAPAGRIVGLVVRRGARLAAWGVGLGLVGVWASTALVARLLYGIGPLDPWTLAGGCLVLTSVAIAASALPAHRAVSVSPVLPLRAE
jgi:putative ABC transport system permease protein